MVYANPKLNTNSIPVNDEHDQVYECYRDGREVSSFSSAEMVEHADQLWHSHFAHSGSSPVYMSVDLETPLGLGVFLSNSSNMRKLFVPSTFNLSKVMRSIKPQQSQVLVCDKDVVEMQAPEGVHEELRDICSTVEHVLASGSSSAQPSSLFSAKVSTVDPFTLREL